MRGILMGALGGFGKGLSENGKAAMEEESKLRMKRQILEMEEQTRADREAAIRARREKIMGSAQSPEEIERAAVMAGDEGLAKYGSGVLERNRNDERYETEQGWKEKDYTLRVDQQRDSSARGWASVNAQNARYEREGDKDARDDAKRQLYGLYLDAATSGNKEDAEAARREGMREFGIDFERESKGKTETYSGVVGVGNTYQRLYEDTVKQAEAIRYSDKDEYKRLMKKAQEYADNAERAARYVGEQTGVFQPRQPQGGGGNPAARKPLSEILR